MSKSKIVCVDFNETCVMHEYLKIGADVPNAVDVLKMLNENQVKIILCTICSDEFCRNRKLGLPTKD
jgi:hypothetical protein